MTASILYRVRDSAVARALLGGWLLILAFLPVLQAADAPKNARQGPKQVLIIRHAEKPPENDPSVHLAPMGQQRATALPSLFKTSATRPQPFTTPDFIFATKNSHSSHRPVETVTPLAKALKLPINEDFANAQTKEVAHEILGNPKYAGKTVLVCWHHGTILELAKQLKATGVTERWHGKVFDRVWQLTYDGQGKVTFVDRPQQLLPKDSVTSSGLYSAPSSGTGLATVKAKSGTATVTAGQPPVVTPPASATLLLATCSRFPSGTP